MTRTRPTIISLFSGAGGLDFGMVQSGLKIDWANDNDEDCVSTYKANIGQEIVLGDIKSIKSLDIPEADIITGGFPCQGFSVANRFRSVEDERNGLYVEMLRIIQDKQPKWFIAENVKGLLSLDKGKVFQMILDDFDKAGYRVIYKVVNMADHGVPQSRRRVLILGTRKDLPTHLDLTHPVETHSARGDDSKQKWVSFEFALKELEKINPPDLKEGSKYKMEYRNFTGHRKSDGSKPAPTILARGNGKGGVNATPHPYENRRLSVRESAYIQTFPHNFIFSGSLTSKYRQIGNAVPVIYGKKMGEQIISLWKNYLKTL